VVGTYPFMEAAFIGGPDTVSGFSAQRFVGDASAYGNAELRLFLGRYRFVFRASTRRSRSPTRAAC
jgi:hypothetical protein